MQKTSPTSPSNGQTKKARRQRRRRRFRSGSISSRDLAISAECIVKDYHSSGAKLEIEDTSDIPDLFTLVIPEDGTEVECEVVWKSPKQVGVEFVSSAHVDYRNIRQRPRRGIQ